MKRTSISSKQRGNRRDSPEREIDELNRRTAVLGRSDPQAALGLATEAHKRALELRYETGVAASLCNRGTIELLRGAHTQAMVSFIEAKRISEEIDDDAGVAGALRGISRVLRTEGRLDEAIENAKQAVDLARGAGDAAGEGDGANYLGTLYSRRGDYRRALLSFRRALHIAEEIGDHRLQTSCQLHIALVEQGRHSDYARTIAALEPLVDPVRASGDRYQECILLDNLGRFHGELGNYPTSLSYYLLSIEIAEALDAQMLHINALIGIGLVHRKFGDTDKAIDYATRGLERARAIGFRNGEATILNNLGNIEYRRSNYAEALDHYNACRRLCEEIGDRSLLATVLSNIANVHRDTGRFDEAREHYTMSLDASGTKPDDHDMATWHMNLGRLHLDCREYGEALDHFLKALTHAESIGLRPLITELHADLTSAYEGRGDEGDLGRALSHHRTYMELREEVLGNEKQREIAELRTRAEIERAERDREIYRLQSERLELDMRHKTEELTAMALHLVEKNELIGSLKEEIERLSESGGSSDLVDALRRRIEAGTTAESDWATFEERLQQVHHGFMTELARRAPALRPAELKVCALLRMQLSTKEIASLLAVTERAVEKHRYQIRKKLDLPKDASLAAFLAGL